VGGSKGCHYLGTRLGIEGVQAGFGVSDGGEFTGVIGGTGQCGAIECGHRLEGWCETEGTGGGEEVCGC